MGEKMKNICVFCGASEGKKSIYVEAAEEMGKVIAERGFNLVYGAGNSGIMGAISKSVIKNGGKVTGVLIPKLSPYADPNIDETLLFETMNGRKAKMVEISDCFIVLPGGIGTLDEFAEVWTLFQLHIINKPCALLNVGNFFDPLIAFIDHMVDEGFIQPQFRKTLIVDTNPKTILTRCLKP